MNCASTLAGRCSGNVRLRNDATRRRPLARQLVGQVRVLSEDAPLHGVALLARHRSDVEWVSRLLVRGLCSWRPYTSCT
jgi:hypothetical protein